MLVGVVLKVKRRHVHLRGPSERMCCVGFHMAREASVVQVSDTSPFHISYGHWVAITAVTA